ncbi:hypothetical protein N7456_007088 [Penicillium angulare]|uniref:C2H2-type domain-containing protein n=1 Tax=Penicillium angulare TaxID=116970 RepID=A0A9W9FIX5_9EURO|nr:hypothetical protein N7456_007088 [Penicillium angulare]
MAKHTTPVSLPLLFAEAFPCRLNHIKTEWCKSSRDLKPDAVLQLAVLLSNIEQILKIEYLPVGPPPIVSKPTCVLCSRVYTRVNDLNHHIKNTHPYLKPIVEAKTCHSCRKEYTSHKKLVSHERAVHKAAYQSRAEFTWPGFVQLDSREGKPRVPCSNVSYKILIECLAQKSFLETLHGGRQDSKIYNFIGEAADMTPASLDTFDTAERREFDEQCNIDNPLRLQYDSGFYGDLTSLLFPDTSAVFESSVPFPSGYHF